MENYIELMYPYGKKRACTLAQMAVLGGKEEDVIDGVVGLESLRPYIWDWEDLERIVRVGESGFLAEIGAWRNGSECLGREVQAIGRRNGEFGKASPFSFCGEEMVG